MRFKRTGRRKIAGLHFPLRPHALVLTGFINDNIDMPVILGHIQGISGRSARFQRELLRINYFYPDPVPRKSQKGESSDYFQIAR